MSLLKQHVFTYGDTKAHLYAFNVEKLEKHYTFIKYNDQLVLMPGESYDKVHMKQTLHHSNNKNEYQDLDGENTATNISYWPNSRNTQNYNHNQNNGF